MNTQHKVILFDGIVDYVLWKCKTKGLMIQLEIHDAIDADDFPKKASKTDKKNIEKESILLNIIESL